MATRRNLHSTTSSTKQPQHRCNVLDRQIDAHDRPKTHFTRKRRSTRRPKVLRMRAFRGRNGMICRKRSRSTYALLEIASLFVQSLFRGPRGRKPHLRRNAVRVSQPLGEFVQLLAECASQPPAAAIRDAAAPSPHFNAGQPERLVP